MVGTLLCLPASPLLAAHKYPAPPPEFFSSNQPGRPLVIVPGDDLTVRFYYNPQLDKTVRVREDGKISLDLFQGISVSGMTPEELQAKLVKLYSPEFTSPSITVDVSSAAGNSVYVTGEVRLPGAKEWNGNLTTAMVLAMSGVNQRTAGLRSVFLIREAGADHFHVYKLNASLPGGRDGNVRLAPGDVLVVPRKFIVKADDFVDQYVRELLPGTANLSLDVLFTPASTAAVVGTTSSASK